MMWWLVGYAILSIGIAIFGVIAHRMKPPDDPTLPELPEHPPLGALGYVRAGVLLALFWPLVAVAVGGIFVAVGCFGDRVGSWMDHHPGAGDDR